MCADSEYASTIVSNPNNFICSGAPNYSGLCSSDMPSTNDKLQRVNLSALYHVNAHFDISGRYIFEWRRMNDWAWDESVPYAAPLTFYWSEPEYDSQVLVFAARYKF